MTEYEDDEIMTAEEFFGKIEEEAARPSRTCRSRGKKSEKSRFYNIKVKMVMRACGVSREMAGKIVAERDRA
jgi:hypothetical protein